MKLRRTTAEEYEVYPCDGKMSVVEWDSYRERYATRRVPCDRPPTWKGTKKFYCGLHKPGRKVRK